VTAIATLAFGSAPIGARTVSDAAAAATIDAAWLAGIRHFDTAPAYGDAERRLGAALRDLPRKDVTISTKVGRLSMARSRPYESGSPADGEARFDFTAAGVRRSYERSCERLRTDRIDVVLLHDPEVDLDRALGEALPAARELGAGEVGVGTTSVETALRFIDAVDVVMIAGRWTLADRSARPLLDACAARGIRLLAAAPFQSGLLAARGAQYDYRAPTPPVAARVAQLRRRFGPLTLAAALRFPTLHPAVSHVVAGMGSLSEVACDAAAWTLHLGAALRLDDAPPP
jgi:D-threo-aldose 1-dehydrogenase